MGGRRSRRRHAEFEQVHQHEDATLASAMQLALLTAQRPADVLKIKRSDVREGALWVRQNKTGHQLAIALSGELGLLVTRLLQEAQGHHGPYLPADPDGTRLSYFAMRSRFDRARQLAGVDFQFRDLRAKAATDTQDLAHSQRLLAHKNREMTAHYVKRRTGERVAPLR